MGIEQVDNSIPVLPGEMLAHLRELAIELVDINTERVDATLVASIRSIDRRYVEQQEVTCSQVVKLEAYSA